jgi:hypothetical protein
MIESFVYFDGEGKEVEVINEPGYHTPFFGISSMGVKWKHINHYASFFEKNTRIVALPCLTKPFVILIYTGINDYRKEKNFVKVVSINGNFIQNVNPITDRSELAQKYKTESKAWRILTINHEKTPNGWIATVTIECVLRNGWLTVYEKSVFDEDKFEFGELISATEGP